ncbi:MAG: exonuclease SbcCD subunit D [Promethearchaeota archaeon]
MGDESIRFLHLGDTHFGAHYAQRPKNLHRRAYGELFFQKVEEVVNKAITEHEVDFIIHSGDFFNRSQPSPEIVDRGIKAFQLASKKEIPVFILPGNHERSRLPLGLIPFTDHETIKLFRKPCSYIYEKNGIIIKITGFPYIRRNVNLKFDSLVKRAWCNSNGKNTKRPNYSILMIHQLVEGSCIENYTFRKGGHNVILFQQIPNWFNYVACGHVHRFQFLYSTKVHLSHSTSRFYSIEQDCDSHKWQFTDRQSIAFTPFKDPIISYTGSPERVSFAERNEPKGYIIGHLRLLPSEPRIQTARFQFYELNAIRMVYLVWDLNKANIDDYINLTLKELYRIHSESFPPRNKRDTLLTAILKVKIKGNGSYSSIKINDLRQEAKRLDIYLTFSYSST